MTEFTIYSDTTIRVTAASPNLVICALSTIKRVPENLTGPHQKIIRVTETDPKNHGEHIRSVVYEMPAYNSDNSKNMDLAAAIAKDFPA